MRPRDLIQLAREQFLDDNKAPFLWSDDYLLTLASEAEAEAATRAKLLLEKTRATANDLRSAAATATTANKLVDGSATFTSAMVGMTVYNTTDNTWARITAMDSTMQLALDADIMASGESYTIGDHTVPLTRICVQSGIAQYEFSNKVILLDRCWLSLNGIALIKKTEEWLDEFFPYWRTATGTPRYFVEEKGHIILVPKPDATLNNLTGKDTLIAQVYRRPLSAVTYGTTSVFEIPSEYHLGLIDYICAKAFGKQESVGYDPAAEIRHEQRFTDKFGPPLTAAVEEIMRKLPTKFRLNGARWD